jgi:hypothetical protein
MSYKVLSIILAAITAGTVLVIKGHASDAGMGAGCLLLALFMYGLYLLLDGGKI